MNIKVKILTIGLQLFGGKMLTDVRTWLAGKKFYLLCATAILAAAVGWAGGEITLSQFIQAVYVAITGVAFKAGVTRDIKNGNGKPPLIVNQGKE